MSTSTLSNDKGHSPNLDTILMVEGTISKNHEFASKNQLYRALPKQIQYPTFKKILNYLEESNKIAYDKNGSLIWIFAEGPKFQKLEGESINLK